MVKGMSVVVNVMCVISPPPALCNLSARTVVKLCTLGVCFRDELGFLNCDDICMCVMHKQFELPEFVFDSVYVDLQSVSLCCVCGRLWFVCEFVVVRYVDGVVAVTVMRVLLFVLHVCLLRECDYERLTAMLVWGMDEVC